MLYLAPLVTLGGTPMLASGTLLWRRVKRKELAVSRMVGTAIAILGMFAVLAGMLLSWPNPASIVPAALFNVAVFTALAVFSGATGVACLCRGLSGARVCRPVPRCGRPRQFGRTRERLRCYG